MRLPSAVRHKLAHLLSLATPLHHSRGVPVGPPAYIQECYPKNCFTIDRTVVSSKPQAAGYGKFVGLRSLSFADSSIDGPAEPPVFNAFENSIKVDEKELHDFLYGTTKRGTVKSISSISSFDPGKYVTVASRSSFSSSHTLRDVTAHLRNPSHRASGFWNGAMGRNSDRNVYPGILCLTIGICISYSYRFRLLSSKEFL